MKTSTCPRICANCKWWVPNRDDGDSYSDDGLCHRYPPVAFDDEYGMFPMTDCDEWCGEYAVTRHPRVFAETPARFADALAPVLGA